MAEKTKGRVARVDELNIAAVTFASHGFGVSQSLGFFPLGRKHVFTPNRATRGKIFVSRVFGGGFQLVLLFPRGLTRRLSL